MRLAVCLLLCFCFLGRANAQDPHFSQFFASPLTLNPAFTGKFDGDLRLAGNYRNQWPTINKAYNTVTLSADFPVLQNHIASNDILGIGVMGYSDQSANSAVKFNYLTISTAFHKGLDEDGYHQIGAAFQGSYANLMINTNSLNFADMLTPLGFTGVTTEKFDNVTLKSSYFDLNAGVLYTGSSSDRNNIYAGISMYHINRPKQYFTGAFSTLNSRITFHGGGFFPVGQSNTLHLSGQFSTQAKSNELVVGGALQMPVGSNEYNPPSFYAGSWFRFNDAIIPYLGLEFDSFRFGVTYDVNVSSLKTGSNGRGGMEISLIYTRKPETSKGLPCPKF
jgi:type IX secretion system PorP/SprF family membrane protein